MPRKLFRIPWRTRRQIRADLDAELEFHFQMRTEELMGRGMNRDEARREAEREFGDQAFTRRYCETLDRAGERANRRGSWLLELRQDLRVTMRGIRLRPAYAAVVLLTLALGVGANTAVFSVLDSVLLRRLPFPNSDRLVTVDELNMQTNAVRSDIAAAEYLDWTRAQKSFDGIAVHNQRSLTFSGGAAPELLHGVRVSANFFDVLGVRPALGRTFRVGEDAGVNRVVVLGDGIWNRLFGGDTSIVTRQIVLGGDSYTVIGVLPRGFFFPGAAPKDFYVPFDFTAAMGDVNRARKYHVFHGFARLKSGVTLEEARADLTAIARHIEQANPETSTGHLATVLPMDRALVGDARLTILSLMGAAGFVLLIVTANLANLTLARALLRRQEFAVRAALGASRGRLMRLALTESVALAILGGFVGVVVAWWGTPALLRLYPGALPALFDVHVSVTALVFALAASVATGIVFGLAPAIATRHTDLITSMRDGARGTGGRTRTMGRNLLALAQVALAMVLVVGAGLLIRTLVGLQSVDLGYRPEGTSATWISLSGPRYRTADAITSFWVALQERLRQAPGVESVGLAGAVPLAGGSGSSLAIDGRPNVNPLPQIRYTVFSDGARQTLGVSLEAGRDFSVDDRLGQHQVVLINRAAAKKFWPGQNPVGARVRLGPDPTAPWAEVVGIVGDYRQDRLDAPALPLAITNFQHDVWPSMFVVLQSKESPTALHAMLVKAVRELDPSIAVHTPTPLFNMISGELGPRRFAMSVLSVFGGVAFLLAVVGIYGVIAYGVTARRNEFGVRLALGAVPAQLAANVLGHGIRLAIAGLILGTLAALGLTRFLSNLLFGVERLDVPTFVTSALLLGVATAIACWLPAWRASAVDPMQVLRDD